MRLRHNELAFSNQCHLAYKNYFLISYTIKIQVHLPGFYGYNTATDDRGAVNLNIIYIYIYIYICRSQWPRGLRRRSAATRLLRSWVRIPPGAWMFVCCECCVLSGRGLYDELITRPEESYRLWCFVVCDLENLKNEEAMTRVVSQRHSKKKVCVFMCVRVVTHSKLHTHTHTHIYVKEIALLYRQLG